MTTPICLLQNGKTKRIGIMKYSYDDTNLFIAEWQD